MGWEDMIYILENVLLFGKVPGHTKKSENGYLTGYQEDENSPNPVPNREAFFLVGS